MKTPEEIDIEFEKALVAKLRKELRPSQLLLNAELVKRSPCDHILWPAWYGIATKTTCVVCGVTFP